jgi:hypothetical protein
MVTGQWYRLSMPVDLDKNKHFDSDMGRQLARGLSGHNVNGDLLYNLNSQGGWNVHLLDSGQKWTTNDVFCTDGIEPAEGYWIKRRTSGVNSNAVYTGRARTNEVSFTFRPRDWHIIGWPLVQPRREDDGQDKGWGFAACGAKKGTSWLNADQLMVGEGSNSMILYLNTNGLWHRVGQSLPATNTLLEAGKGYYYYHAGTGFTWTVKQEQ